MRAFAGAALLGVSLAALPVGAAHAQHDAPDPACDALVQPDRIAAHSGHGWHAGPGLWIGGDKLACNYYQDEVPAGLSLSVRPDPQKREYALAHQVYAQTAERADGPGEAFYFRYDAAPPFQPSWGLVVYAGSQTYRLEGVPEAGDAKRARVLALEIIERTLKKF